MSRYPRRGDRPPWSWHGITALVLAVCVGGGWLTGVVFATLEARGEAGLDTALAGLLNGIGQVLAGALGTYLGFSAGAAQTAPPPGSPAATLQPGAMPPGGGVFTDPGTPPATDTRPAAPTL